jgi:hypothetical protein
MTREEFREGLKNLDFFYERENEFNRDVFVNDHFQLVTNDQKIYKLSLVIHVDRYTMRLIWWLDDNHKVTTSCYMHKEVKDSDSVISLLVSCVKSLVELYKVDLNKYTKQD